MTWAQALSRDELIDHIEAFRTHPDFVAARNDHLAQAVRAKDVGLVEVLLDAGAGPDWVDETGESLMHYLSHEYQVTRSSQGAIVLKIAEMLLTHGADPNMVGAGNWRAMDRCIKYKLDEMSHLLISFGADPKLRPYV